MLPPPPIRRKFKKLALKGSIKGNGKNYKKKEREILRENYNKKKWPLKKESK